VSTCMQLARACSTGVSAYLMSVIIRCSSALGFGLPSAPRGDASSTYTVTRVPLSTYEPAWYSAAASSGSGFAFGRSPVGKRRRRRERVHAR
jgi:hypothetical protein